MNRIHEALFPIHVWLGAVLSVGLCGGCSSLRSYRFSLPEKEQVDAPGQSSISQLGAALPAMKPGDDYRLCVIAADQMSEQGLFTEAVEMYLKAESLDTKKPLLDAKLAPAFAGAGRYSESLQRYRRLIEAAPKDAALRNNMAWTLMESGHFAAAEQEFKTAIQLAPGTTRAEVNLGLMYARQKRFDAALATLTPVIGEAAAHHNVGVIAVELGDEAVATQAFQQAAALPGAPPSSREFLASLVGGGERR